MLVADQSQIAPTKVFEVQGINGSIREGERVGFRPIHALNIKCFIDVENITLFEEGEVFIMAIGSIEDEQELRRAALIITGNKKPNRVEIY